MLDEGFGYVRISQFQSKTAENMVDAIEDLKKEAKGSLKGMVLDLRNNPGGVLTGAVAVSDAFRNKTLIERHRMVYDALGDAMQSDSHALSIKAYSPEEAGG